MGFLASKTDPDFLANVHLDAATPAQIAHGKALVVERGCAVCHEINGVAAPGQFRSRIDRRGKSAALAKSCSCPGCRTRCPITSRPRSESRARSETR